jgi:subtilisin family serine protease
VVIKQKQRVPCNFVHPNIYYSISIAGPKSKALDAAISGAMTQGVHVVVAAGNFGTDACEQGPANSPNAFSVGSIGYRDELSSLCSSLLSFP